MSQPSITMHIQNLENEYGTRFFDRSNKGVTLTKEGQIFYQYVLSVLDLLSNAKDEMNALAKDQRRPIYIGATLTIAEYILPNILTFLHKTYPDIDYKIKIVNTDLIFKDIIEKNITIGLIEGKSPRHNNLKVENFWEDELVVVVPNFHPWASRKNITLAELLSERLITREEGSGTRRVMEMALKERGIDSKKLNVTMELGSTQVIKQLVSAGLGITIISSLTVSGVFDQKEFKTLEIHGTPIYRPLSILTNTRNCLTNDERILINILRDHELLSGIISNDYELEDLKQAT